MGHHPWIEVGSLDDLARADTPIHRLDARAKVVVTLAFVAVTMSYPRSALSALTPLVLYPVAIGARGRVPLRVVAKALLAAAPFVAAVGLLHLLLDRAPAVLVGRWSVPAGWVSFASILLRLGLTVSAALAMVACTGMYRLAAALPGLGLPRVFAAQLVFLYRYLFVVGDETARMRRAADLRSAGRPIRLRVYGSMIGHLLLRAMDRAERVYRAMRARGYDGAIRGLRPAHFGGAEALFVAGWLAFFAVARRWNLALWVGRWIAGEGA